MHESKKPFAVMHRYRGIAIKNNEIIYKVDRRAYVHGTADFTSRYGAGQKSGEEIPADIFQFGGFLLRETVKSAGAQVQIHGYDKSAVPSHLSDSVEYRVECGKHGFVRFDLPVEAVDQFDAVIHDREEKVLFVFKILVKSAVGNTGVFADVGYRGMMISLACENFRGGIKNKEPPFIREFQKCVFHESTFRE